MADSNICSNCAKSQPISFPRCVQCHTPMLTPSLGSLAFWLLGDVDRTVASELARRVVGQALGVPVTIQPARLDPRPSERPTWNGRSGTVILNQLLRRNEPGCLTNVALVGDNLVSCANDNWLFGYAYVGWAAACMSFDPLQVDNPDFERLMHRAKSICLHEIGHTLGLADHTYENGPDCCMLGEVSMDSLFLTDSYSSDFCGDCLRAARKALYAFGESIQSNRFVPGEGSLFSSGRYELRSFVGQGGMGTVWKAKDLHLDQDVALKFVAKSVFDGPGEVRLRDEAAKARRLSHPNIVRVFDFIRESAASLWTGSMVRTWKACDGAGPRPFFILTRSVAGLLSYVPR
jgi:predicted Zn-dependent protease